KVMADDGIDAVEVSRAHYESWPGMVLGHYKGFISGQVKEGSGTKMSWRGRMTMLPLAPIIERAAERLAPGGEGFNLPQAEKFTAPLDIPVICAGGCHTAAERHAVRGADFTRRRGCRQRSRQIDVMRFRRRELSSPTPTCSRTYRRRYPEDRC